ncbi:hypothetical protein D3C76_1109180 [compost metagenome]
MFTDRTITVIALDGDGFFRQINYLVQRTETNHFGNLRISVGITVGHTHTATDAYIKSDQLALLDNRYQAKVL